jgi:hypothetical protein
MAQIIRFFENGDIIRIANGNKVPDKENGNRRKCYEMDYTAYRKLASSCVNMFATKRYNPVFFTFTIPTGIITEQQANKCFSKLLENLTKNYKLHSYVWTKEIGGGTNIHYHVIFDIPFSNLNRIKLAWFHSYRHIDSRFANNNLRLPLEQKATINTLDKCLRYICKYATKARKREYQARCYGISRNIQSRPRDLTQDEFYLLINSFPDIKTYNFKYLTVYSIQNIQSEVKF